MAGKVFISCGQATDAERAVARDIETWFRERDFTPYVAVQAQTLADVNSGIIDQLKASDFYVFIDFRRERLLPSGNRLINPFKHYAFRGSLFTSQELAIVFLLKFDKVIFLRQHDVELNGLMRYMGSNATAFRHIREVPQLVAEHARARDWTPTYTRHLSLGKARWSDPLTYFDHTGQRRERVFYVDVHNHREDLGAMSAVARLQAITPPPDLSLDRSPLKTTGQPGFFQMIWPSSHACWDFLAVDLSAHGTIYVNSALDSVPRQPVIAEPGEYVLEYEVFAEHFPVLRFAVDVSVSLTPEETTASLRTAV